MKLLDAHRIINAPADPSLPARRYALACGFTPLALATGPAQKKKPEHSEIARLLIAKGADPAQATAAVRKNYNDVSFEKFAESTVVGDADAISERISTLQDAGIDYLINYIPGVAYDLEPVQRYAEEIIPAFGK